MISLSSPTYDVNGNIALDVVPTNLFDATRRGSVTATLDGSVSFYDTGYSFADQTIKCAIRRPEKSLLQRLQYLIAHYGQIVICCEAGAFLCVPSMANSNGEAQLSFRLIRRLN
jgi:hypothetical protein